jgi:single-stranded DNA-binding protein
MTDSDRHPRPDPPENRPAQASATKQSIDTNEVRVAGYVYADPIIRTEGKNREAHFHLEVQKRNGAEQDPNNTFSLPVILRGAALDSSRMFLRQWSLVLVEGRLESETWKNPHGVQRTGLHLDAYKVQSLARGQSRSQGQEIGD